MIAHPIRSCAFGDACDMVSVRPDGENNISLNWSSAVTNIALIKTVI